MRFGQTQPLKTAKGKIAVGLALILFCAVAVLAAPTTTDRLLCSVIGVLGVGFIGLGVRQDKNEKNAILKDDKEAKH